MTEKKTARHERVHFQVKVSLMINEMIEILNCHLLDEFRISYDEHRMQYLVNAVESVTIESLVIVLQYHGERFASQEHLIQAAEYRPAANETYIPLSEIIPLLQHQMINNNKKGRATE